MVLVTNASSDLRIWGDEFVANSAADTESETIAQSDGKLYLTANIIENQNEGISVWWANGEMHVTAKRITNTSTCTGGYTIYGGVNATPTGECFVNADLIQGLNTGQATIGSTGSDATSRAWIRAAEITCANSGDHSVAAIGNGFLYVTTQKLIGGIQTATGAPKLYVNTDKVSSIGGALLLIGVGTTRITVDEWDPNANNVALGTITGGVTTLSGGAWVSTASGSGISLTGGTLRISTRIDVSAASGAKAIVITPTSSPILIVEPSCKLLTDGVANSVAMASGSATIVSSGYANVTQGAGVTVTGALTVVAGLK